MKPVDVDEWRFSMGGLVGQGVGGVAYGRQGHFGVETAVVAFDLQVDLPFQLHQTGRFHAQTGGHSAQLQQAQDHVTRLPVQHYFSRNKRSTISWPSSILIVFDIYSYDVIYYICRVLPTLIHSRLIVRKIVKNWVLR